ncbi:LysR family transcriptional regulator [Sphingomonas sp.]|uniref:LysR family transcriptional regulator n=1 Tax=Sphingomonas sp. TaxID=28214 RepID=UPI0035A8C63B
MEMQQVRYFLAVARALNFTRAAEECAVTQPALTRAIRQLEEELGGDLLRREGRLSHLTDLGQRMLPLLQQCYDSALTAKSLAAKVKAGELAAMTLAVSRALDLEQIISPLTEMYRKFPGLQLKLRRGTGEQIAAMLKNGEVELAIGGPLGESWDRLEAWPMFSEAFDLVVGADHSLAARNEIDLDIELVRDLRFLVHGEVDAAEFDVGRLRAAGISLDHAHEVDTDRDLESLVVGQFGVAIVPASAMNSSRVRHLNCSALDLRRTVAIYIVTGRPRTREAAAFLTLVRSSNWSQSLA